jgi:transposase InsO family protein
MIKTNENQFPVGMMCRLLSVSRSGYYSWRNRPLSGRDQANQKLVDDIKRIFDNENGRPGSPRISKRLQEEGGPASRHRVAKLMRDNGLRAKAAKKYKATTNSNHSLPVAPNRLEQNFEADVPDQKWVSDITYIWTEEGWLYLAVVLELYSRRVIGWAISERMTAAWVCDALIMALWRRHMPKGVIVHSDRGSQYCSAAYQKLLSHINWFVA